MVKNLPANTGDAGLTPESGRSPGEENGYPLQYSCLENPHGQRSLAGHSPWDCKESDTTERPTHTEVLFGGSNTREWEKEGKIQKGGFCSLSQH